MDDDSQKEKPSPSAFLRHRSPAFSKKEIKILLNLIEKHKTVILNKSTSAASNSAKEMSWSKITKIFNSRYPEQCRNMENLKMKWDNLKKDARRLTKNLMDVRYSELDEITSQMVRLMCEAENITSTVEVPIIDEVCNESDEQKDSNSFQWDEDEDKDSDNSVDKSGNENERLINSFSFSPQECNLLLQCVRQEKGAVFCKENTIEACKFKNNAWTRIAEAYNKQSPQKKPTKVLRTKYYGMKKMAKKVNFKRYFEGDGRRHEKLVEDPKAIKSEPVFEYKMDSDVDNDDADNDCQESNSHMEFTSDPLSTVLNDPRIGTINNSVNNEVVKLKLELLNYKLETAKLKRRRIEEALKSEESEREARAMELSLRVRTAKLEAAAAEMKLPPDHPARLEHYTVGNTYHQSQNT